MNGADEHGSEPVEEYGTHCFFYPLGDAVLELSRGSFSECESNDGRGLGPFRNEAGDPPGDGLCLS